MSYQNHPPVGRPTSWQAYGTPFESPQIMNTPTIKTFAFTPAATDTARRLRVQDIDGTPWFVVADVTRCIGSVVASSAGAYSLALKHRGQTGTVTLGSTRGPKRAYTVSLAGLKGLLGRTRMPDAEEFRAWVSTEVLPEFTARTPEAVPAKVVPVAVQREFFGDLPHVAAALTHSAEPLTFLECLHAAKFLIDNAPGMSDAQVGNATEIPLKIIACLRSPQAKAHPKARAKATA